MLYERILAAAVDTPWAVTAEKLDVIRSFLIRKANGETIPAAEVEAARQQQRPKSKAPPRGVGIIPVYGTLTQRADWMSDWSGGTSTEVVGRQLDDFMADPSIEAVVLDVDSPGGSVYGTAELGDKIRAAGKAKKVIAVANSVAASGAYWLAAQASELVVTPGGQVGSIGVFRLHMDESKRLEASGVTPTFVYAGERKTAGHSYGPLDATGREEIQASVNDYYDKFVRAVAAGRNATLTAVREGFGKGGMVRAEQAVREGMADKVGTLESVLARYGLTMADVSPAAQADPSAVEIRKRRMLID